MRIASEKRLIDINKAFETVTDLAGQADTKSAYAAFWKAGRAIQNMNTVDAVEVVRCKDCKHGIYDEVEGLWKCVFSAEYEEEYGDYFGFIAYYTGEYFCANGEKRYG